MKAKLFMIMLAAAGLGFASCDKDDDNFNINNINPEVANAFSRQYPGANRVDWGNKQGYYVADFTHNGVDAEAWYDGDAVWQMTETDVRYVDLPAEVKATFELGDYAQWRIEDIDKREAPGMETVYIIEVEQGETEYDLYYSSDGVFVKAVLDSDNGSSLTPPANVTPSIEAFIAEKYPNARIVDTDRESYGTEVDIIDGYVSCELLFSTTGEWVYTKVEIRRSEVPAVVMNGVASSQYGSWHIDDIDHYVTPTNEYYMFELESGNREIDLKVDVNGNII